MLHLGLIIIGDLKSLIRLATNYLKIKMIKYALFFIVFIFSHSYGQNHYPIKPNNSEIGKQLYEANCSACHGINLAGANNWKEGVDSDGQRLAPPLNGTGHTWHHSDKLLQGIIKNGLGFYVKDYKGKMNGFSHVLNDEQIDLVLAYVKSYWKKDAYEYQIKLENR